MASKAPIALITGSLPPHQMCGIGDYAKRLYDELRHLSPVDLVYLPIGRGIPLDLFRVFQGRKLVHAQYPSEGWGRSLAPAALPAFKGRAKLLVTLHEWSIMHPLRRRAIAPMLGGADGIIFVSPLELRSFQQTGPARAVGKPAWHVPIGINLSVPALSREEVLAFRGEAAAGADRLISHFGFVHEGKQPEKLLETVARLHGEGISARLAMVGGFQPKTGDLESRLRGLADRLGIADAVSWLGFVEDERAAALWLSASDVNVSLFEDGLSTRRGSFWYSGQHGCHVVTTEPSDPLEFEGQEEAVAPPHVRLVPRGATSESLAEIVRGLPPFEPFRFPPLPAPTWRSIAEAHARIYEEVLSGS